MNDYEVLIRTQQNSLQLFYFQAKNIKKVLKKIKKLNLSDDLSIHRITLILDGYARVLTVFNRITNTWTSTTYYRGDTFTYSFKADLDLDESDDFDRALNIAGGVACENFNLSNLLIAHINSTGEVIKLL